MLSTKHPKKIKLFSLLFSKNHLYKKTLALVSVLALIASTYIHTYTAHGIDYTFTQTQWNGGQTTNTATHTNNQTDWNQYNAKDANISFINGGADMQITNTTNTTHIDFTTEGDYIQQDANNTDFTSSQVTLHGSGVSATGGTITYVDSNGLNPRTSPAYPGGYTVHKFTSSGTFTVANSGVVQALVVAGGGGGGGHGGQCLDEPAAGGGGAGGVVHNTNYTITAGAHTVTIGSGGTAGLYNPYGGDRGGNGQNSVFSTLTALGGGGGGGAASTGNSGGSGGGGGGCGGTRPGGTGLQPSSASGGYGNNGGTGILQGPTGGGGGAGSAGGSRTGGTGINVNGVVYATGGYAGGSVAGAANTGNGGAGSTKFGTGGVGGSGVVIVRYPSSLTYPTTPSHITTNTPSQKNTSTWGALTAITTTQTTPANTNIKYLVSFNNKSTWQYWNGSSWQASTLANIATNGMTKTTLEAITPSQWNTTNGFTPATFDIAASLSTSDSTVTPSLDNIHITYTVPQTQTLTSNIYNTQDATTMLNQLQWSEALSPNTDIQFQLRTSPDGTNWTPWCGPDNNTQGTCDQTTYFTDPTGSETIDDIQRDKQNDQFIQYKAFLSTTDGLNSPTLNSVTLSYGTTQLPTLSTQNASAITPTTATVNGTILTTGDEDPARAIEWGTQSGNYTNSCTANTGGAGPYACQLTNLTPQTTYYFRAKATNTAGTSYGQEHSFTTLANTLTIPNPDTTKIENAVNDGYMTVTNGTLTDAAEAQTYAAITMTTQNATVTLPQNTAVTGDGNFNFQQFTLTPTNVQDEQSTSRVALHLGIPNESLTFSQPITMEIYVGTIFNNHQMEVLYQNDNESDWHHHTYCTIANGYCTFTTTHATIYTVNGNHQTTGDTPMNLNVEIQETLSMDCFDPSDSNTTVSLGTTTNPGMITAGTPAVGQSRCTVTTNADQGYYLTLTNANPENATLTHTDPHTGTLYEVTDQTPWNETTKTTSNWISPTTKGLAFSVITFPESNTTHNQFNGVWNQTNQCPEGVNPDTNDYAGIPTTPQAISAVTSYQSAATTTNICYKVDVPASQPSGQYSGQVMFTATSDASGYYQ